MYANNLTLSNDFKKDFTLYEMLGTHFKMSFRRENARKAIPLLSNISCYDTSFLSDVFVMNKLTYMIMLLIIDIFISIFQENLACLLSCLDFAMKVGYICFFPSRL